MSPLSVSNRCPPLGAPLRPQTVCAPAPPSCVFIDGARLQLTNDIKLCVFSAGPRTGTLVIYQRQGNLTGGLYIYSQDSWRSLSVLNKSSKRLFSTPGSLSNNSNYVVCFSPPAHAIVCHSSFPLYRLLLQQQRKAALRTRTCVVSFSAAFSSCSLPAFGGDPADRFPWKLCYGNKYMCQSKIGGAPT